MVIEQLHEAGLEDPFEITPRITGHVTILSNRYHPGTQLQKAIILFRSIIPSSSFFEIRGRRYHGFIAGEGGLETVYNDNIEAAPRQRLGSLLADEIITAPLEERIANCLESSHLLTCFLRTVGIEAHLVEEPNHVYVTALLDGERYRLDTTKLLFIRSENGARTDRESIAWHYSNEGSVLRSQGRLEEAIRYYDRAIELNPDYAEAWYNKGVALQAQGNLAEAIECYDRALALNPDDNVANHNRRMAQQRLAEERNDNGCNGCATMRVSNTNGLFNLLFPEIANFVQWLRN